MQIIVRTSDRALLQYGLSLAAPPAGAVLETTDAATDQRVLAALAAPNSGLTISPDHLTVTALPPPGPPGKTPDQQTVANWAGAATPGPPSQGIAQAIARLLGAL